MVSPVVASGVASPSVQIPISKAPPPGWNRWEHKHTPAPAGAASCEPGGHPGEAGRTAVVVLLSYMTQRIRGIDIHAEGTGISRPLSENVNLLGGLLGAVIRERAGEDMLALVEELRTLCKRALHEDDPSLRQRAAERIRTLNTNELQWLLRAFAAFLHLVNQAERQEILRVNRERSPR